MGSAIERLAAELMKLSADEWTQVAERRIAGHKQGADFGRAWDEISERLAPRELMHGAVSDSDA